MPVCRSSNSGEEGEDQEEVKGKRLPKVGVGVVTAV